MKFLLLFMASNVLASSAPHRRGDPPVELRIPNEDYKVSNSYIVMLKKSHTLEAHFGTIGEDLRKTAGQFDYMETINAYSFTKSDGDQIVKDKIRTDKGVELVEQNTRYPVDEVLQHDTSVNSAERRNTNAQTWEKKTDDHKIWHLAMVGGYVLLDFGEENNYYNHITNPDNGAGVQIYILDTGIRTDHREFGGRARNINNGTDNDPSPYCRHINSAKNGDTNGHGTHVAGTAAGSLYGIAYAATIVNVKILCDGKVDTSSVARAINDITKEHKDNKKRKPRGWNGSVINMSIGGKDKWPAVRKACEAAYNEGIPLAVAAGNGNEDAGDWEPCNYDSTYCTGASNQSYSKANFSNYGATVNGYAPGVRIKSADYEFSSVYMMKNGTSMATPMVAGIFATFLSFEGEDLWNSPGSAYRRMTANTRPIINSTMEKPPIRQLVTTGIIHPDRVSSKPYAGLVDDKLSGTCQVLMREIMDCASYPHNLWGQVTITGPNSTELYKSPGGPSGKTRITEPGLYIKGPDDEGSLPGLMRIIGENRGDYIQFYYNYDNYSPNLAWTAGGSDGVGTTVGPGNCTLTTAGDWDGEKPPKCKTGERWRTYSCSFPC